MHFPSKPISLQMHQVSLSHTLKLKMQGTPYVLRFRFISLTFSCSLRHKKTLLQKSVCMIMRCVCLCMFQAMISPRFVCVSVCVSVRIKHQQSNWGSLFFASLGKKCNSSGLPENLCITSCLIIQVWKKCIPIPWCETLANHRSFQRKGIPTGCSTNADACARPLRQWKPRLA